MEYDGIDLLFQQSWSFLPKYTKYFRIILQFLPPLLLPWAKLALEADITTSQRFHKSFVYLGKKHQLCGNNK